MRQDDEFTAGNENSDPAQTAQPALGGTARPPCSEADNNQPLGSRHCPPAAAAGSAGEEGNRKKPFHSNALPSLLHAGRWSRRVSALQHTEQLTPAWAGATAAQQRTPVGAVDALRLHADP